MQEQTQGAPRYGDANAAVRSVLVDAKLDGHLALFGRDLEGLVIAVVRITTPRAIRVKLHVYESLEAAVGTVHLTVKFGSVPASYQQQANSLVICAECGSPPPINSRPTVW